jgi:excisionase family DNA binding protein
VRHAAGIPAAPRPDPDSEVVTIAEAAARLRVSTSTVRRWLREGLLPAEQSTPHAPWRIRLTDEVRRRFVPEVPNGFVPLAEAARRLGVARQTVLHKVQRGELRAVQVTHGRRKGFGFRYPARALDCLSNDCGEEGSVNQDRAGPSRTTLSRAWRKSSWPRCSTTWRRTERWKVKSNSSSVLRAGKRAALMRLSPPCDSREATSVESNASAKRS